MDRKTVKNIIMCGIILGSITTAAMFGQVVTTTVYTGDSSAAPAPLPPIQGPTPVQQSIIEQYKASVPQQTQAPYSSSTLGTVSQTAPIAPPKVIDLGTPFIAPKLVPAPPGMKWICQPDGKGCEIHKQSDPLPAPPANMTNLCTVDGTVCMPVPPPPLGAPALTNLIPTPSDYTAGILTPGGTYSGGGTITPTVLGLSLIPVTAPDGTVSMMQNIAWPSEDTQPDAGVQALDALFNLSATLLMDNFFTAVPRAYFFLEYAALMQKAIDTQASTLLSQSFRRAADRTAELGAGWKPLDFRRAHEQQQGKPYGFFNVSRRPLSAAQMEVLKQAALKAMKVTVPPALQGPAPQTPIPTGEKGTMLNPVDYSNQPK